MHSNVLKNNQQQKSHYRMSRYVMIHLVITRYMTKKCYITLSYVVIRLVTYNVYVTSFLVTYHVT
jgi:hypothetical protein